MHFFNTFVFMEVWRDRKASNFVNTQQNVFFLTHWGCGSEGIFIHLFCFVCYQERPTTTMKVTLGEKEQ